MWARWWRVPGRMRRGRSKRLSITWFFLRWIWPTSINIVNLFSWNAARKRDEMLELYEGKPSRTVLRRESGSNPTDLAGTIFGGFAPQSQTAEVLSKALGSQTVQSGSVSKGKGESSQSLQMVERPLMTPDELKSIPKGQFVVMKTGTHPMQTRLRLFLDWGITFGEQYQTPDHGKRKVYYADRRELEAAILKKYPPARVEIVPPPTSQAAPRPRPRPSTRPTEGDSSPVRPPGISPPVSQRFSII